ncbi:MAG: hypothetical protein JKX71_01735 [Amylibacter sp.]|nr:hypothetical protein [Amylibacter sp.]
MNAAEICNLNGHGKLSLADFEENSDVTDDFYFGDALSRDGRLIIVGRNFEIEYEKYNDVYKCEGRRNEACIRINGDKRFIGEARIDKSIGVVVQIERHIGKDIFPFSRGGVADASVTLWKIESCN